MYNVYGQKPTIIIIGTLSAEDIVLLSESVRCPDFRGCSVHKQHVLDSKMCPEASLYQGGYNILCAQKSDLNIHPCT